MKKSQLQSIIREEVKKTLHEGALLKAINPGLQGEVLQAVASLEKYLLSIGAIQDYKHAGILAELVVDIIDAAKADKGNETSDF